MGRHDRKVGAGGCACAHPSYPLPTIIEKFVTMSDRPIGSTLLHTFLNTLEIPVAHLVSNAEPSSGHRAPRSWETEPKNV
ncbi:hypothetical protein ACRBEV_12555 [Methylobacterium phyllosphaerae]